MEAVRSILTPQSEDLIVKVPKEFVKKKLEVIILPFYQEERDTSSPKDRLMKIFNESKGILPMGYKFNRDEAYEWYRIYRHKYPNLFCIEW